MRESLSKDVEALPIHVAAERLLTGVLGQGCRVTAHDLQPIDTAASPHLFAVCGNILDEALIEACIARAKERHGPIHILVANPEIKDESHGFPIWETPLELWQKTYDCNICDMFITIKRFLRSARNFQSQLGGEPENLTIVVTGGETGKFGQAGHTEFASGKASLQYGLVRSVENEIVRWISRARINAVAPTVVRYTIDRRKTGRSKRALGRSAGYVRFYAQ